VFLFLMMWLATQLSSRARGTAWDEAKTKRDCHVGPSAEAAGTPRNDVGWDFFTKP
jgi:hypothetical protein